MFLVSIQSKGIICQSRHKIPGSFFRERSKKKRKKNKNQDQDTGNKKKKQKNVPVSNIKNIRLINKLSFNPNADLNLTRSITISLPFLSPIPSKYTERAWTSSSLKLVASTNALVRFAASFLPCFCPC